MSHAYGAVRFPDGHVMFYEYNGTADVATPRLWETTDELEAHWRESYEWESCTCGGGESVLIYASYAAGSTWRGEACRACALITNGFMPGTDEEYPSHPDWVDFRGEKDR